MRAALFCLALAGCATASTGPYFGAGVSIGPGGVAVAPVVSGSIGGVGVSASSVIY